MYKQDALKMKASCQLTSYAAKWDILKYRIQAMGKGPKGTVVL